MLQTCPSSSSFSRLLSSSSSSLDEDSLSSSALRHKRKNQNLLCSWFHKDHLTCPEGEGTSTLTQPEKNAVHRGLTSCRWLECQNVLGSSTAADPESARQCWEHQIHSGVFRVIKTLAKWSYPGRTHLTLCKMPLSLQTERRSTESLLIAVVKHWKKRTHTVCKPTRHHHFQCSH